ncbi:5231_t:CDS:10 [Ambispora gerdemannii]|uniref:5231_t:CDS:1 n=1 Tax=Ambispora gerdemannii TaxID=144530 RepID=A0A9N8WRF6_9GLOM|nr:5231_t:CDS:10 [Ambispora gerdemannii]
MIMRQHIKKFLFPHLRTFTKNPSLLTTATSQHRLYASSTNSISHDPTEFSEKKTTTTQERPNVPVPFLVFNRDMKTRQRSRAAIDKEASRQVDYLKDEVAQRIVDRILDVKRDFSTIVDLGSGCGHIAKFLDENVCKRLIMCDMSDVALNRHADQEYEVEIERKVVDEELLPFEENSLEAVVSNLSLHWVNDLPGTFIQIRRSLKPDGVFIAALFGGETLFETSLQLAESEREGGISPRVSPMTDVRDLGSLLSRADFTLTTIDIDEIVVNYPSAFELMLDLRAMGESNAVINRRPFLKRDTLIASAAIYKEMYGNPEGTIPATFQIMYVIGWKPDVSQPKPKARGSAGVSLKEVLEKK